MADRIARSLRSACILAVLGTGIDRAADTGPMVESLRLEGIHWPGEGGKRIQVSLGVYLIDFARINLREESFDMAGYLDVSWTEGGRRGHRYFRREAAQNG
jgi:hypothetical protein